MVAHVDSGLMGAVTSQRTRIESPPRMGSLHMNAGLRKTSESSPGAWPVEEPS